MIRSKYLTNEEKAQIRVLAVQQNSHNSIAEAVGISKSCARSYLNGLEVGNRAKKRSRKATLSPRLKKVICRSARKGTVRARAFAD